MTIQGYIIITIISAIIALVAFVGGNWLIEYVDTTENKRAVVLIRLVTKLWRKTPAFRHGDMSHSLLN